MVLLALALEGDRVDAAVVEHAYATAPEHRPCETQDDFFWGLSSKVRAYDPMSGP